MLESDRKKKKELTYLVNEIEQGYRMYNTQLRKIATREEKIAFIQKMSGVIRKNIERETSRGREEAIVLKKYLADAYALATCAIELHTGNKLYKCQMEGGILLNDGYVSQMATGEGKTRTAILPAYLNALTGKGVNVITTNDYLSGRDYLETREVYEMLGMSCGYAAEYHSPTISEEMTYCSEILGLPLSQITPTMIQANKIEINKRHRAIYKEKQKQAYEADVVYSSKDTLAFDYLKDVIAESEEDLVQLKKPNFAIVDEVDSVLFEDAQTPFSLSGTSKTKKEFRSDEERKFMEQQEKDLQVVPEQMNQAVLQLAILSGRAFNLNPRKTGLITKDNTVYRSDINRVAYRFSKLPYVVNHPLPRGVDMPSLVEFDAKSNAVTLTEEGHMMIYQYFNAGKVYKFSSENTSKIMNFKENGRRKYRENIDYTITADGTLKFTEYGLIKALRDEDFKELSKDFNHWSITEEADKTAFLANALTAHFSIVEGRDYQLHQTDRTNTSGEPIMQVELIMNGRTSEGRVYSNGLQQAIELKEKTLSKRFKGGYDVKVSPYKDTLASIPATSFFRRFSKVAGMTGTSAKEHFKDLYGLRTFVVERNKKRRVVDRGDVLYLERKAKDEAVVEEVLKSMRKNQPVLLSTTDVAESKRYMKLIGERLARAGYSKDIILLNAEVKDREKEAKLIARAGLPGAITIATNMAGRGTDIKLGGVEETLEEAVERIKEEKIRSSIALAERKGRVPNDKARQQLRMVFMRKNEESIDRIIEEAKQQVEQQRVKRSILKKEVEIAGGLKVVCAGHFRSEREDSQVKGRCGRQGEKGETIFISCPQDLIDIGMDQRELDKLRAKAGNGKLADDPKRGTDAIRSAVLRTQERNDFRIRDSIEYSEKKEGYIAGFRNYIADQRYQLREKNDYTDSVRFVIEETTKDLVGNAMKYNSSRRQLADSIETVLGIKVDLRKLDAYRNPEELVDDLTNIALDRFEERTRKKTVHENEETNRKIVNLFLDRVWTDFEDLCEGYKNQERANALTQYQGEPFESLATKGFFNCMKSNRAELVKAILNPQSKKKVLDIFPIYTQDIEKKEEEGLKRKGRYCNFKARPAMFTPARKVLTSYKKLGVTIEEEISRNK